MTMKTYAKNSRTWRRQRRVFKTMHPDIYTMRTEDIAEEISALLGDINVYLEALTYRKGRVSVRIDFEDSLSGEYFDSIHRILMSVGTNKTEWSLEPDMPISAYHAENMPAFYEFIVRDFEFRQIPRRVL